MGNNLQRRVQQGAQPPAEGEKSVEQTIRDLAPQFQMAMPRGAEATQLVRDALTVIRQSPKLLQVDKMSLLGSLMTCAQLGLRPGVGALGHAYIIPFKGQAQLVIGYQGMLELANRSGDIEMIVARVVHQNDVFSIDYGADTLVHQPAMNGRGPAIGYYAKFYRKGSQRATYEFMSKADAEEHRNKFAMAKDRQGNIVGPWRDHFDAMALKTVVRRVFKWMPRSTQIQTAIIADETVRMDYTPDADVNQVVQGVPVNERGDAAYVDEDGVLPDGVEPPADDARWAE